MPHPFLFLLGYRRLRFDRQYAGEVVNVCRQYGFVYRNLTFCGAHVCMDCGLRTAHRLKERCREREIPLYSEQAKGLPALFIRYHRRWGIFVGMLAFAAILFFSGRVLWSIRVEGNRTLSDEEVIEELRRCGMTVGDRLDSLDTAVLENRMLIASDEISWITVNLIGTVAEVEIREVQAVPEQEASDAANLVAAADGVIDRFEDVRGNIAVKIGDRVSAGELLVGGIYDLPGGGYRYTCAHGRVFARTKHVFEVEIPLTYEKKVYTGEVKEEKYLIFFEKEVKIFGNVGNSDATYDIINTVEYWELPGQVELPVGIRTVRYREYRVETAERREDAAAELAQYRLRCIMEAELPTGQLMRKAMSGSFTDTAYLLRCEAEYVEDIARTQPIELEGFR